MLSLLLSRLNCCHEPEPDERNLVTISYREDAETDPPPRQAPPRSDPEVPVPPLELKVEALEDPGAKKEEEDPKEEEILEVEIEDENLPESKEEFVVREEVIKDRSSAEKGVHEAPEEKMIQEGTQESENVPIVKNQEMLQEEAQELPTVDDDEGRTSQKGAHFISQNDEVPKRKILFYLLPMRIDAEEAVII